MCICVFSYYWCGRLLVSVSLLHKGSSGWTRSNDVASHSGHWMTTQITLGLWPEQLASPCCMAALTLSKSYINCYYTQNSVIAAGLPPSFPLLVCRTYKKRSRAVLFITYGNNFCPGSRTKYSITIILLSRSQNMSIIASILSQGKKEALCGYLATNYLPY